MANKQFTSCFNYPVHFGEGSRLIWEVGKAGIAYYNIKDFLTEGDIGHIGVKVINISVTAFSLGFS